ncbi:MAG: hypothetical protein OQJ91_13085 [Motiliproteus sp.]|nr:hypothetical protein [Motiliproteus sp.]
MEEKPGANIFELLAHINSLEDKKPAKPEKQKNSPLRPSYTSGDLRPLRDDDPKVSYANYKSSGVIVDIREYL